jgi:predicted Zn-dependent protease with MMP-like domain
MSQGEFDKLVEKAIRAIPRRFRRRLHNVVFLVEREPPQPGLLGLYHGRPLAYRSVSEGFNLPDQITIYQGPHERLATPLAHKKRLI